MTQVHLGDRLGHLAYSTLVHPGDTWAEMRESLETFAPAVKARVSPASSFGLSLRISAASATTLTADPAERARLRRWLDEHDMYVYTVNAFPYGPFKNRIVKKQGERVHLLKPMIVLAYEPSDARNRAAVIRVASLISLPTAASSRARSQVSPCGGKATAG